MNIPIFRPRASQVLLLILLVQVALIVLVFVNKSWMKNLNLFHNLEHGKETEKNKNIPRIRQDGKSSALNFFAKYLPIDDEKRLVNLIDFDYKIKKEWLCQNDSVLLLVTVSSAPGHELKRKVIRETWGQSDSEVKIIFMLGVSDEPNINKALQLEDMTFHDIVQGNFLDSYKNMTYKSTMGLKYVIYNCPKAKFLIKCDDDVLLNLPLLKNFIKNDLTAIHTKNSIFCTVSKGQTPIRDKSGSFRKWYVSYKEWPKEHFPLYCAGWFFITNLDIAFNIYRHAQNSTFFWIDDVFLTGIAAKNVHGLKYVDISKFTLAKIEPDEIVNGNIGDQPFLVGSINMAAEHIRILWQYLLSKPVQESIIFKIYYNAS